MAASSRRCTARRRNWPTRNRSGQASEARFIAEDLVAREPWDAANIERFRRTLTLLGEAEPDGIIAALLSGDSPFMSNELSEGSLFEDAPRQSRPPKRMTASSSSCWPRRPSPTNR